MVEVSEPFSPLRYEDPELKAQVFAYQCIRTGSLATSQGSSSYFREY